MSGTWHRVTIGNDLHTFEVYMPALDGTPIHVFTMNARDRSWDVQTPDRYVVNHGGAHSLEDAQSRARDALWLALCEMRRMVMNAR